MDTGVRGTVKFRIISIALTFGIVACAVSIAAQKKSAATSGPVVFVQDKGKRGVQTFPVLIPQELTPGTITVQSTGSASADGKTYEGLKVNTSDLEILLLLDGNHRLMRLEVPDAKVSVVRE